MRLQRRSCSATDLNRGALERWAEDRRAEGGRVEVDREEGLRQGVGPKVSGAFFLYLACSVVMFQPKSRSWPAEIWFAAWHARSAFQ